MNDWLTRSKQNIYDFKMVRDLEKNELVKQMTGMPSVP
jgi:hypothetical protein